MGSVSNSDPGSLQAAGGQHLANIRGGAAPSKAWKTPRIRARLSHQGVEAVGPHSCNITSKHSTGREHLDRGFCETFSRPVHKGIQQLCERDIKGEQNPSPRLRPVRTPQGQVSPWPSQTAEEQASSRA